MLTKNIHFSFDLEAAVLGACMLEKTAFGRTHGIVEKKHFYHDANQIVYEAIDTLYRSGIPVDILTVVDHLYNVLQTQELAKSNADWYVVELTRSVVSSAHLEAHCLILKRMWMEREVIRLTHGGLKLEGDVNNQLIQLQTSIRNIREGEYTKEWFDMGELMIELAQHQDAIAKGGGEFIRTGITDLDQKNGGLYGGQMVVIGARPSVGKSAFMGQMAVAIAKTGKKVGIVSLEMKNSEVAGRLSSLDTGTDFQTVYRNLYRDENDRARFYDKIGRSTVNLPIYVTSEARINPVDIHSKLDRLKSRKGVDIAFIDYLQLISADQPKNKTRENVVSEISRACKLMAMELNIPVVLLCQLNRESVKRKGEDRYPNLSDLRESGSIEQDADIVMFVHRDWAIGITENQDGGTTEGDADLIVRKWRNGVSNLHIPLKFDGPTMSFKFSRGASWKPLKPESNDFTEPQKDEMPF